MPGPQQPPVKKNRFILDDNDIKTAPKTAPTQQPKSNPFVLDDSDLQNVKKKDGTTDSGIPSAPTSSPDGGPSTGDINLAQAAFNNKQLTPEAASVLQQTDHNNDSGLVGLTPEQTKTYIDAHNAPSISDLTNKTYNILSTAIPASTDPKINAGRQQLLSAVKNGDQGAITTAKNFINTGIQKQINDILQTSASIATHGIPNPTQEQKDQIAVLKKQAADVTGTLNEYAINSAANQKEVQTQVKAEVSGVQRGSTPNIAAEDLGKTIEKVNGGLPNPNGNLQYERQKAGFEALINNKQLKINDLTTNGLKSKNQALLQEAEKQKSELETLKSRADNLINQFPDVAVTQVARAIGDEISETHPRNMVISKSDVLESAQRIEAQHPGFMAKYGKQINTVAESEGEGLFGMFKEGFVPKGGFTGGFNTGANELMYGGADFVAKRLGDTQTADFAEQMMESPVSRGTKRSGETPTKVVYDNNGQAFKEKPNEDYGKINWNSGTRYVGQALPGLIGWVLPETAGVKVAEVAGAGKALQQTIGLITASAATGYDNNYKLAESLIDDKSTMGDAKKAAFATMTTLMTAGAFKLVGYSPTKFVENAVTKSIAPDIINALEENGYKQLPKNKLQDLMVNTIIPKVKTFSVEQAKAIGEGAKVAGAQLADTKVKEFISQVINPEKANATTVDENIKSFTQQALFMGLLGLPKSIVGGITSPTFKDALYEIGTRAPQYIERINQSIANGDISPERGNQMIAAAKTMGEEVEKAQYGTTDDGHLMTVGQKRDLAVQQFRKRAAAGFAEQGLDVNTSKVNSDADDQIKNVKSQNTYLPLEKTEAFQTAVEVNKEGEEIGKPATLDEIHDNSEYRYSKNGRETTTSGLEFKAHIPDSEEAEILSNPTPPATTEKTPEENISTAKELLKEAVDDKKLPGIYGEIAARPENEEAVLKDISRQAHGVDEKGEPLEGGPRADDMKKSGNFPPELVDAAMAAFPIESLKEPVVEKTNVEPSEVKPEEKIDEELHSPKTNENESQSSSQGNAQEKTGNQEVPNQAGSESQAVKEGDVKAGERAGETPAPSTLSEKQKQINGIIDKINKHNDMKTTSGEAGAPKRALLNEIRTELPDGLHIKVGKNGKYILGLYNEAGKKQQARSEVTNRTVQAFDKTGYRPETIDFVNHLSSDPVNSIGLDVQTVDGRDMSPAQLQAGLKDIADGKDTVGAKQIYDAVEKMHEDGMVSVKDNATGNKIGIPIKEFTDEMKKPLEPLTDDQIMELNTELGNDAFRPILDDVFNDFQNTENGQHSTTASEAEQPSNGSATDNQEKTGTDSQNTADNQKLRSEQEPPGTGETGETSVDDEQPHATGVKKAVINSEREAEGKSPIENQLRRDFGDVLDNAKKLIKNNGSSFVLALKKSIDKFLRPLTAEETVALSLRKAELNNEAKEFSQNVIDAVNSGNKADELTARTRLQQIDIERDNIDRIATRTNYEKGLSLAINKLLIQDDYSAAKIIHEANGLTASGEITPEQKAKFEDLAQKLADAQKKLEEHQQRIAHLEAENKIKEMQKQSPPDKFKEKKDKIRAERKSLIDEFKKEIKGGGEGPARQGIPLTDKMATIIAKLARNYVEDGIVSLHEIVSKIIDDLKEHAPGLDEENVRNSISGYGRPTKSTRTELTKKLDDLRKQAELTSKIEDLGKGKELLKAQRSVTKWSDEVQKLQKQLDALTESQKPKKVAPEKIKKTQEEIKIQRLEKELSDLQQGIAKQVSPKSEDSARAKALKEEIFEAKKNLGLIRSKESGLPKSLGEIADKKIEARKKQVQKQIDELNRKIKDSDFSKKDNGLQPTPDSELNNLNDEKKQLLQKLKDAMVAAGVDPYQEKALNAFKSRLKKQAEELQRKLREKDFAPQEKKTFKRDSEGDKLQADVNGYKKDIRKEMKKIELDERPKWLKTMDFLAKWRRAVLLSSVTTLGKLTSAALERSIISPMEELAGSIIHFIPGLHQISLAAPREGGLINLTAEKAAAKVWIDKNTLIEAGKELKGKSSLKLLYGKENDLPDTALDWFGRVHAALKTPAKIAEFERSIQKRSDWASANGFDVNDPVIHASLEAQAYIDANRAIFQQNNILADKWQQAVESLGRGSKSEKAIGDIMKTLLPIVRVPTNFVWESTSYAIGALKAIPNVVKAIHSGVQSLHPDEADFVIRALKKQGLGIGIMALGYFAAGSVGGYYTGKRKEGDLKAGDVTLFGVHLPHWMLHAPLIEMLQIGATLRRVNDDYNKKGKPGGGEAAGLATVKGLYGQVPFFATAGGLGNALESSKSLEGFGGEFVKSFAVPPTVQSIAKSGIPFTPIKGDVDEDGNEIERKPQTFLQHIESGIPGLREKVPTPTDVAEEKFQQHEKTKFDKQGIPEEDRADLIEADREASEERKRKKEEPIDQ
jgi:hypothetical protein